MSWLSSRTTHWLADNRRFWAAAGCLFAALALLKGLRLPSRWAATQAFLDYRQGFIKRGLFGEVLSRLGLPAHYDTFVWISAVALLAFCVLLLQWIRTSGVRRLGEGSIAAVFAASYAITYIAQLLGYLEIPAGILVCLTLLMSRHQAYLVVVVAAGCLGILMHENYLLTFLPVTLLPAILEAAERASWRAFAPVGAVGLLLLVVTLAAALEASLSLQQLSGLRAAIAANADFAAREDFFPVLARTAGDNLALMAATMRQGRWWLAEANAFIVFAPGTAFFLWLAIRVGTGGAIALPARTVKILIALTGLCPLSLQLFGWDIYRWYAIGELTSFLTLTVVCHHAGEKHIEDGIEGNTLRNAAIVLIGLNLATGTSLFGNQHVDMFPFIDHWRALLDGLSSGLHWSPPAD